MALSSAKLTLKPLGGLGCLAVSLLVESSGVLLLSAIVCGLVEKRELS